MKKSTIDKQFGYKIIFCKCMVKPQAPDVNLLIFLVMKKYILHHNDKRVLRGGGISFNTRFKSYPMGTKS